MTPKEPEVSRRPGGSPYSKIQKRVWIKASPDVVFQALTDSRDLVHWFCDRASCDAREGGELVAHWRMRRSTPRGRAVFTRIVPGAVVELLWVDDGGGVAKSEHTLRYQIRSRTGLTEVEMLDRDDSTSDEETYACLDQGWNSVLLELKDYCERKERSRKGRSGDRSPFAAPQVD